MGERSRSSHVHRPLLALLARGREIGFAIFDGRELLRFGVRSVRGSRRGARFVKRVAAVLDGLSRLVGSDVCLVAETNLPASAEKGGLNRALREVIGNRKENHAVRHVSLPEAKRFLCGSPSATQGDLIAVVAERHPICRLPETPKRVGVKPYGVVGVLAAGLGCAADLSEDGNAVRRQEASSTSECRAESGPLRSTAPDVQSSNEAF